MATLVRWNPFGELDVVERRMRRMLEDIVGGTGALPAADVYETEGEYVFEIEAPGFDEKELTVEVSDHTLMVKGEKTSEKEENGKTFRLHERLEKTFERRFELPPEADPGEVDAKYGKGVLTVRIPKTAPAKPQKIEIGKA